MGALSDLLKQPHGAANLANRANQRPGMPPDSQKSQDSQGGAHKTLAHLLALAERDGYAPAIVHRLHADDVAACVGLDDDVLRAYLHALDRGAGMDAGIVPPDYTQAAHCDGCGPVWLWPGTLARVLACPWCFRRKAGKAIPRPPVTCGACRHYAPDPLNPPAGVGSCGLGTARALWPMKSHYCADHSPSGNRAAQANPLMISYSVSGQQ